MDFADFAARWAIFSCCGEGKKRGKGGEKGGKRKKEEEEEEGERENGRLDIAKSK